MVLMGLIYLWKWLQGARLYVSPLNCHELLITNTGWMFEGSLRPSHLNNNISGLMAQTFEGNVDPLSISDHHNIECISQCLCTCENMFLAVLVYGLLSIWKRIRWPGCGRSVVWWCNSVYSVNEWSNQRTV